MYTPPKKETPRLLNLNFKKMQLDVGNEPYLSLQKSHAYVITQVDQKCKMSGHFIALH